MAGFHLEELQLPAWPTMTFKGVVQLPVANTGGALRGETAIAQQRFRDTTNRSHTARDTRFDLNN